MSWSQIVLLFVASALAAAINSIAGGGTLLSYPVAVYVGLPPVVASATNSVAQAPGALAAAWAYRRELRGKRRLLLILAGPSFVGGILGSLLLLSLEERAFELIVPWMVLFATLLIFGKDFLWKRLRAVQERATPRRTWLAVCGVLGIAVYSGYFGAGKNILLLAMLTLVQKLTIHELNAVKCAVTAMVTSFTAVYFISQGAADPTAAPVMALGTVTGAYSAASLARRVRPLVVRYAVVAIGLGLAGALAYQRFA
jgi:uncharacterized membrane protein YfcA